MPQFEAEVTDLPPSLGFDLPFDSKTVFGKVRVRWIEDAKRDETRRARVAKAATMLGAGVRHP